MLFVLYVQGVVKIDLNCLAIDASNFKMNCFSIILYFSITVPEFQVCIALGIEKCMLVDCKIMGLLDTLQHRSSL